MDTYAVLSSNKSFDKIIHQDKYLKRDQLEVKELDNNHHKLSAFKSANKSILQSSNDSKLWWDFEHPPLGNETPQQREKTKELYKKFKLPMGIIIGTMKSGTGILREYMDLHSQINTPDAEINFFFDKKYRKGYKYYSKKCSVGR